MSNVFILTNINTKIIKGKLSKLFISEVFMKLVALRIRRYTRSSSQLQKGWWPLVYVIEWGNSIAVTSNVAGSTLHSGGT